MTRRITLIAGPTASGKSAAALALAEDQGGHIVNADSMQVYDVLRVLTARPEDADLARAPHHLYGHVPPAVAYSAGQWARDVVQLLQRLPSDMPLIFAGGTGLYFRALTEGLSPMPDIDPAIRTHWRERLQTEGAPALHSVLAGRDPEAAANLQPTDSQRIARALEVLDASGKSILWWQSQRGEPLIDAKEIAGRFLLLPDREVLRARIDRRFDQMAGSGALEEVKQLKAMGLDAQLPAMRAIGVPEFAAVLDGAMPMQAAIDRAKAATRQYAKRQMTWWRNQLGADWTKASGAEDIVRNAGVA